MENIAPTELKVLLDKYSPFIQEVKKRLFRTLIIFALATSVGFVFYKNIIRFLISSLSLQGINLVFTSPFQYINLAISSGVTTGLMIAVPILIFQVVSFLKPALNSREYGMVLKFLPFSIVLFLLGFAFGISVMVWEIQLFAGKALEIGISNILDISRLLSSILLTATFMGAAFEFPVVLLLLMRIGLVKSKQLASKRKWIYLAAFFFAILLPIDSILTDILLSLPLIFLFEFTLLLNWLMDRKSPKKVITTA